MTQRPILMGGVNGPADDAIHALITAMESLAYPQGTTFAAINLKIRTMPTPPSDSEKAAKYHTNEKVYFYQADHSKKKKKKKKKIK